LALNFRRQVVKIKLNGDLGDAVKVPLELGELNALMELSLDRRASYYRYRISFSSAFHTGIVVAGENVGEASVWKLRDSFLNAKLFSGSWRAGGPAVHTRRLPDGGVHLLGGGKAGGEQLAAARHT
jgi:hypothetical protein